MSSATEEQVSENEATMQTSKAPANTIQGDRSGAQDIENSSEAPHSQIGVNNEAPPGSSAKERAENAVAAAAATTESSADESQPAGIAEKKSQMQSLEIDMNGGQGLNGNEADESFDEDGDMEHLLGEKKVSKASNPRQYPVCSRPQKVGNMRVFFPHSFYKNGWGIAGPHWFGPFCVLFLIGIATHYFFGISIRSIGPVTTGICTLFAMATTYNLINVAYRDPGVVKLQPKSQRPQDSDEDQRLQYRWCDRCQIFQPVDGAHCSDCNVCVAGFDHHCVWMGTCIGRNNFKQFVLFNITWLLYLMWAITWVSVLGPLIWGHHHHHNDTEPDADFIDSVIDSALDANSSAGDDSGINSTDVGIP